MEGRTIEYRHHGGGLDYHNSPLIGEIPNSEYHNQMHRSIDQLRSLNERGELDSSSPTSINYKVYNNNTELHTNHERIEYDMNDAQPPDKIELKVIEKQENMDSYDASSSPHHHHSQHHHHLLEHQSPPPPTMSVDSSGSLLDGDGRRKNRKKIFSSKADLQLHTQIHMREAKPYKCSQCSKAFANSSYLSQHTRIHLGIKPYRCEICQRKFTQLSHLQQHIRTHTGDKPYKCRHPGCQKAFSQLSNLQSHSRCHQTDKPYKCNSCYKCFSDEPSLLEHIPKHKESKHLKTHICQYCGKSYTQETYLSKHMQKHAERTDKRPPITTGLGGLALNRNLGLNAPLPTGGAGGGGVSVGGGVVNGIGDHPYWPKVSPDSAASLTEVMQHQQQHSHHDFGLGPPPPHQNNGHIDLHQSHHHRMLDGGGHRGGGGDDVGEDLVVNRQNVNGLLPPPSSSAGGYDPITKTTTNSAFTPINSMTPHLNSLQHHPMAQRPYLYDAISFQNKNVNQNAANSFPNQLISLHQIRNYAHQPSGLMSGEHMLGVSVGKDKG